MAKNPKRAPRLARILIVDDHPVVREGLRLRLSREPDLEVCGEAADIPTALRMLNNHPPDVAIVDISLGTGNGIDLIKRFKARKPELRILVWSMHSEALYAERALRAGAMGYLNKANATDQIIHAIRRVLAGKVYLSEQAAQRLLNQKVGVRKHKESLSPVDQLSDRELEVFQLIGHGKSTEEIASGMHLSEKTVSTYRARIKTKLNVTSFNELMQRAVQWVLQPFESAPVSP